MNKTKSIAIIVKKAPPKYDLGASKFFGVPTIPAAWQEDFSDDEIIFCQIRLSDVSTLDTENRLPHTGYLYVFLHTEDGKYHLRADVRYFDGEPDTALDCFNEAVEGYEQYNETWLMEFREADGEEICTRLFGIPSDWSCADEPRGCLCSTIRSITVWASLMAWTAFCACSLAKTKGTSVR